MKSGADTLPDDPVLLKQMLGVDIEVLPAMEGARSIVLAVFRNPFAGCPACLPIDTGNGLCPIKSGLRPRELIALQHILDNEETIALIVLHLLLQQRRRRQFTRAWRALSHRRHICGSISGCVARLACLGDPLKANRVEYNQRSASEGTHTYEMRASAISPWPVSVLSSHATSDLPISASAARWSHPRSGHAFDGP